MEELKELINRLKLEEVCLTNIETEKPGILFTYKGFSVTLSAENDNSSYYYSHEPPYLLSSLIENPQDIENRNYAGETLIPALNSTVEEILLEYRQAITKQLQKYDAFMKEHECIMTFLEEETGVKCKHVHNNSDADSTKPAD